MRGSLPAGSGGGHPGHRPAPAVCRPVPRIFPRPTPTTKNVFIAEFRATNPAIFGKSIRDVALHSHHRFVISRLWREGRVSIPTSDTTLQEGDHLLIVTSPQEVEALHLIFGRQEKKDWNTRDIDWNAVDRQAYLAAHPGHPPRNQRPQAQARCACETFTASTASAAFTARACNFWPPPTSRSNSATA